MWRLVAVIQKGRLALGCEVGGRVWWLMGEEGNLQKKDFISFIILPLPLVFSSKIFFFFFPPLLISLLR